MRAPSLAETECDAEAAEIEVDGQEPLTVPENLSLSQIAQAIFEEQTAANLTIAENEWEPITPRHKLQPHVMQVTTTPEPEATETVQPVEIAPVTRATAPAPEAQLAAKATPEPTPMPATPVATLAPGFMPLGANLAKAVGLDAGLPVTADEFGELAMFANGLPARFVQPKKDVRQFIWKIVLKRKEQRRAA